MTTATPEKTAIAARAVDATKIYGSGEAAVHALDGVNVEFESGRFNAIMGPSGSGKSTLLHCMAGLDRLTSGQVFLGDIDLTAASEKQLTRIRRDHVGFVFQTFNLVPTLNALENILPFFAIGFLYAMSSPSTTMAWVLFGAFVVGRYAHTLTYLAGAQPWRTAAWQLATFSLVGMLVQVIREVV